MVRIPELRAWEKILAVRYGIYQYLQRGFGQCTAPKVDRTLGKDLALYKPSGGASGIGNSDAIHRPNQSILYFYFSFN
jgi:hypothetical protein